MNPIELAGFVCEHLAKRGIGVVLSGGACVAHYSNGKYVSMDLDFVNEGFVKRATITAAMAEIGFAERRRYFRHPDSEYLVEFPPGPLGVGEEKVRQVLDLKTRTGTVRIISPTDCVKDRLAGYYHWDDLPCLEQAILVAQANDVDLDDLARWSEREGKAKEFAAVRAKLTRRAQPDTSGAGGSLGHNREAE
jgi:hypothetical protein